MENIKRLVFDLDDTLIPWKDEYNVSWDKALKHYNLDYIDNNEVVSFYENKYRNSYNKKEFLNAYKEYTKNEVPIEFVDEWLDNLGHIKLMQDEKLIDTLKYLSKKYDIVVLTNWFTDCQTMRLNEAGLLPYISKVYGAEDYKKPNPKSYKKAIGDLLPEECVMIGDNLIDDIEGAKKVGMKVIYLNKKDDKEYPFITIKDINELKEIL